MHGVCVLNYVELFVWISMWFMMITIQGFQRCNFWCSRKIDPFEIYPYCFNGILPQTHF